jgi:hypothetical protein
VKKVLTFSIVCGIIYMSRGEENKMYSARLSQSGTQCAESGNSHLARLEKNF